MTSQTEAPDGQATRISVTVNGRIYHRSVEPRMTLADFLRDELGLPGTHIGCEHGVCGACTILFDGKAVRSCIMYAVQAGGHDIRTVEALAEGEKLHPLQEAFAKHGALQCGFCTPGFLMTALEFIEHHADPGDEEVRLALSGNICRCTGYQPIVQAVKAAAAARHEKSKD